MYVYVCMYTHTIFNTNVYIYIINAFATNPNHFYYVRDDLKFYFYTPNIFTSIYIWRDIVLTNNSGKIIYPPIFGRTVEVPAITKFALTPSTLLT